MTKKYIIFLIFFSIIISQKAYSYVNLNPISTETSIKSNENKSEIQLYCGYWMIHPILSKWNTYNWLEKRNYQSFFQNIFASYKFIAIPKQDLLIYIEPNLFEYSEQINFIEEETTKILKDFSKIGWKLNNDQIKNPYHLIIYIMALNLSANVIPIDNRLTSEGLPLIIINARSLNNIKNNPCLLSHSIAHLIFQSIRDINSLWLTEALATWMETLINDKCENINPFLIYRARHPEIPLDYSDPIIGIGDSAFINLIHHKNNTIINTLLNQNLPLSEPLKEIDTLLNYLSSTNINDLYEEYALLTFYQAFSANIFNEKSNSLFPYSNSFTLQPHSAKYLKFTNYAAEALNISYPNKKAKIWLFLPSQQVNPIFEPLPEYEKEIAVPVNPPQDLFIIIINPSNENSYIDLQINAQQDYPIKLTEFKALINKNEIILNWNTLKERDTLGWIIYKKTEKDSNFEQLNSLLIPAAGNSDESIKYMYIDRNIKNKTTYQYLLLIITKNHFIKKGPIITIKLP